MSGLIGVVIGLLLRYAYEKHKQKKIRQDVYKEIDSYNTSVILNKKSGTLVAIITKSFIDEDYTKLRNMIEYIDN